MGSFYILAAIFIWSSLPVFVRLLQVDIATLMFYSALTSVLLSGAILLGLRQAWPSGKGVALLLALGPLSLLNIFTYFYAMRHTSVANAVLTHYIAPVVVAFLALLFLGERLTWALVASIGMATVGLWVMLGASPEVLLQCLRAPQGEAGGIFAGLFSGLMYALIIVVLRVYARSFHPLSMCFFQNIMMALLLAPFLRPLSWELLPWLALMGVVHSTLAPVLYFRGMALCSANRAAVLGYTEPVWAILLGLAVLKEVPSGQSLAGGVLILLAGYLTLRSK